MILHDLRIGRSQRTSAQTTPQRQKQSRLGLSLIILCFFLLSSCASSSGVGGLNITGSTSVAPFIEHLAELYQHEHEGSTINVQSLGSTAGIQAALDGVADIGMSSRTLTSQETTQLDQLIVAQDALAIIVHPLNPVSNLDQNQIQAVFKGEITNWAELGGSDSPIVLVIREAGSGTFGAFEELVMEGEVVTPAALRQGSNGAIRQIVSGDPNAIGYISLGVVDTSVKALTINGISASVENVIDGDYTFVRPFLFVWKKETPLTNDANNFISYLMSEQGQTELERLGLVRGATTR